MDHPDHSSGQPGLRPPIAGLSTGDPRSASARVTGERGGPAASTNDSALALRLQARDATALAELYRAHRRRAFGLAYRVLGDGAAAEDAVQAAFLALWERADRITPAGSLGALVMTVVHRRAVDLARRRARTGRIEVPRSGSDDADATDPSEAIPDEAAQDAFARILEDDERTRRRLSAALDQLPQEQRAVVELAYFEGLTHRVIAERLGLPGGTVKSRLRLGLGHLRDALKTREGGA